MRFVLLTVCVFIVSLTLTLAGTLALTGQLNSESLNKLLGRAEDSQEPVKEESEEVDPLAQQLKERARQLEQEQAQLAEERKRLQIAQQELEELQDQLEQILQELTALKQEADADYQTRLQDAALTLGAMDDRKAAEALQQWPPEYAAEVLRNVKEKQRAKILDAMKNPEDVALILERLKGPTFPSSQ